jgi:hypothetical protein
MTIRRDRVKCFYHVDRLNHVSPKNEIDNALSPSQQDKHSPTDVPAADNRSEHQPDLVRISHNDEMSRAMSI